MSTQIRDELSGQMRRPRLLLADDHTILLEGIARLLQSEYDILPTAGDGQLLVQMALQLRPDVIITDISMPVLNGIEAARQIQKRGLRSKVIFLTMHGDVDILAEALAAGASGFVIKHCTADELRRAIEDVLANKTYVTPKVARDKDCVRRVAKQGTALTAREREVLQLVAEGRTINGIAEILKVAGRTVVFHKTNIMDKLNLRTTADLTQYAVRHRLISV